MTHPNDMTREQLRELVSAMSWAALDLAQHLNFTTTMLKYHLRSKAYRAACQMAYDLTQMPFADGEISKSNADISVFGANGIEKVSSFIEKRDK